MVASSRTRIEKFICASKRGLNDSAPLNDCEIYYINEMNHKTALDVKSFIAVVQTLALARVLE